MSKLAIVLSALLLAGCAARYRLPGDSGWGYDGEMNGMKMVAAFENQSLCETRRASGLMFQATQATKQGMTTTLGTCEPMTVAPGGTLYWGIGVPRDAGFILFRDEKTCEWFRSGWTQVPTWQKTNCMPLGLQRVQLAK
jgi:hypothetical protein